MKTNRPLKKILILQRVYDSLYECISSRNFAEAGNLFKRIKRVKLM